MSSKALAQFTSQLATLISAGLPLVRCLRVLEGQMAEGALQELVEAVADDVEGGAPLSEALAKYPETFDRLYVNMVRAGEAGGVLAVVLDRLAGFGQKNEEVKSQLKSALTYPVLVMAFAGLIVTFVMIFVVPKFEAIFTGFGTEMPGPTRVLMGFSRSMAGYWWAYLSIPVLLFLGFRLAMRSETFATRVDRWKLAVPLFGDLQRMTIVARFTRTMGTLLQSGVPILESLAIIEQSITNRVVSEAVGDVHDSIREGETIAQPLGESGVFDDIVVNMIDVGEQTGQLDAMLLRIADNYEAEVDVTVSTVFKAIEPILLLVMAVVVGGIVIALFLPIVSVMNDLSTGL
ncbi:MAG: type II secretion system F family protein [Planctomycetota bacterium]|nr:type II secretion system F family protein [Planctomycetota bacterium]